MSEDITTRLRRDCMSLIADEAADEIERLRKERDEARRDAERWQADALRLLTERNAAQEERDELVSIADKASKERDEARREICSTVVFPSSPQEYANRRGWECFGEHGK